MRRHIPANTVPAPHLETLRTRKLFFLSVSDCVGLSENGLNCSYVHHHHRRRLVPLRLSESLVWQDLLQGCTNPGWLYFVRWLSVCGSSVWHLLYVTHPSPRTLRWLLDFLEICGLLIQWIYVRIYDVIVKEREMCFIQRCC